MTDGGLITRSNRLTWFEHAGGDVDPMVLNRCTLEGIQSALADMPEAKVRSVDVNRTGKYLVPPDPIIDFADGYGGHQEEDLPGFCRVVLDCATDGGHSVEIEVWVPLLWNGRFIGSGGGGNRLRTPFLQADTLRLITLPTGIRNGFTIATSDGGYGGDKRFCDWHLDARTGDWDDELVENWVHRSTHLMTVVGKAVAVAVHGRSPKFSYFMGTSGGGRQGAAQAQRYPEDYDGLWIADPAINWTKFIGAQMWPPMVMKEYHPLGPAKLNAFRAAALTADGPRFPDDLEASFDAATVIGTDTAEGVITAADASVMQMIWDGPTSHDGDRLWFGLLPGTESWGSGLNGAGLCITTQDSSQRQPVPFNIAESWFAGWINRDEGFDWRGMTLDVYGQLFERGVTELAHVATDDPDLSGLHAAGNKLLITHGTADEVIFPQGTTHYFRRVLESMDGSGSVADTVRLFMCPGDGHSFPAIDAQGQVGAALDLATGMTALMRWVESGHAPDDLEMYRFDLGSDDIVETVVVQHWQPQHTN